MLTLKGKNFESMTEAAQHFDIPYSTFVDRVRKYGKDNDKVVLKSRRVHNAELRKNNANKAGAKRIVLEGVLFLSWNEAADHYGIDRHLFASRCRRGIDPLLPALLRESVPVKVRVKDKTFPSISAAARFYGLEPLTVTNRIGRGWPIEEALELSKRRLPKNRQGVVYKITNSINNKVYVGLTTQKLKQRFSLHLHAARNNSRTKLSKAIRQLGSENFSIHAIAKANSISKLANLERRYIKKYEAVKLGYNGNSGGACH